MGLVILPALAFPPVALGVSGIARRHWRAPWFSSPLGFLALSVEFYPGCLAPLACISQAGLVALLPGEALTRMLGLLLLDLILLLIGAETAGGVMTKFIAHNITVLGALNSDVHAKLPFLWSSLLLTCSVACRSHSVFGPFSARSHEAPCSWQLLFVHLFAVDSLDVSPPLKCRCNVSTSSLVSCLVSCLLLFTSFHLLFVMML